MEDKVHCYCATEWTLKQIYEANKNDYPIITLAPKLHM